MRLLDHFRLDKEKEDYNTVIENVTKGVPFRGTNLWILVFAIFIASLGLNVNSTAVIIGAMLISPIMGPIMGMGLGMAINDLALFKKAFSNYLFAAAVGLATSAVYFLLTPINEAHSEILARTSPNIYDVLIALFGGFAGILATSTKQKGNVIPGVAIATALMPPLCTAGYGLATLKFTFFFGALYLFLINTVFIALATLVMVRYLKFPFKHLPDAKAEKRAKRIVWAIVIVTLLPSIYFGYDIVQQQRFNERANRFIENEAIFPNDYLLKKNIDPKEKTITLTFGGEFIDSSKITTIRNKLPQYDLEGVKLEIRQGFAYLNEEEEMSADDGMNAALQEKEIQLRNLSARLDSINQPKTQGDKIFKELKVQYPSVSSLVFEPVTVNSDSLQTDKWMAVVVSSKKLTATEKEKMEAWMKVRVGISELNIYFEP